MQVNGHTIERGAHLGGAHLQGAHLRGAYLRGAKLKGADLEYADLEGANLRYAELEDANLEGANLRGAKLQNANLQCANLRGVNLLGSPMRLANLKNANLQGANLHGADLRGARLEGAVLPNYKICPEEGAFVAYKKTTKGVVVLEIPADSRRTACLRNRKCRAEYVRVISGHGMSKTFGNCYYYPGGIVRADSYDPDIRVGCSGGIHFFMSRREVEDW